MMKNKTEPRKTGKALKEKKKKPIRTTTTTKKPGQCADQLPTYNKKSSRKPASFLLK
jgi:hypothetical protein